MESVLHRHIAFAFIIVQFNFHAVTTVKTISRCNKMIFHDFTMVSKNIVPK